ncbi:DUF1223 domain-containing protein [Maribacter sp. 2210JD10-5]|uniref:DUF1223 domain-containing protein n=1 Tax=Maribacter sp. 2210JD10-5 TaxID=3386272 RepID=UPI0039BD29A4
MKKFILPVLLSFVLGLMAFEEYKVSHEAMVETKESTPMDKSTIVLELFTSQGCSSCPPADNLLKEVKEKNDNVLALSYHVDYWNYIGWEDPFSKSAYTVKQRNYNRKFRSRSNYTPQLVINGQEHLVGSNRSKVLYKIDEYGKKVNENNIKFNADRVGRKINFEYEIGGILENKEIRAVLVLNERITSVKRGENRNRVLKNSNIVVAEKYLDIKEPSGTNTISIPNLDNEKDELSLLLISQDSDLKITGAAQLAI